MQKPCPGLLGLAKDELDGGHCLVFQLIRTHPGKESLISNRGDLIQFTYVSRQTAFLTCFKDEKPAVPDMYAV